MEARLRDAGFQFGFEPIRVKFKPTAGQLQVATTGFENEDDPDGTAAGLLPSAVCCCTVLVSCIEIPVPNW